MSVTTWGWLILAFPLAGSVVIGLTFKLLPAKAAGAIGTLAIALAFACSIGALLALLGHPADEREFTNTLYDYAGAAGIPFDLGILVDPLSVFMACVVTGVSMLIHLYSFAYMGGDAGYRRFFSYLNFFVFSMLLLVLAGNYLLLIVGWAFVGYASYALISFWYRRETATKAGMKAFVINVIGDIGLVFAAILLIKELGVSELRRGLRGGRRPVHDQRVDDRRDLPAAHRRRDREVRAGARCTPGSRTRWRARPRSAH